MLGKLFGTISLGTIGSIVIFLFVFGALTFPVEPLNVISIPILIFAGTLISCIVAGFIFKGHPLPIVIVVLFGMLVFFIYV